MEDDFDLMIQETAGIPPLNPNERQFDKNRRKFKGRREKKKEEEAKNHFEELSKATEIAHRKLVERGSPYRFCVYRENGEIMIDIVLLDTKGKIRKIIKKNLTHEEFSKWMRHIDEGEGIFVDDMI